MSRNKILYILITLLLIVIIAYSFQGNDPEVLQEKYAKQIDQERREKNGYLRSDETSPFNTYGVSDSFKPLNYYEPDLKYKVEAQFTPIETGDVLRLPTNDGDNKIYIKQGYASFELEGKSNQLLVLGMTGPFEDMYFIPFADSTSGEETYGGGRYLEVEKEQDGKLILDFNKAYNPYCAYVPQYSCPLPPAENFLSIPIYAGEKNFD